MWSTKHFTQCEATPVQSSMEILKGNIMLSVLWTYRTFKSFVLLDSLKSYFYQNLISTKCCCPAKEKKNMSGWKYNSLCFSFMQRSSQRHSKLSISQICPFWAGVINDSMKQCLQPADLWVQLLSDCILRNLKSISWQFVNLYLSEKLHCVNAQSDFWSCDLILCAYIMTWTQSI